MKLCKEINRIRTQSTQGPEGMMVVDLQLCLPICVEKSPSLNVTFAHLVIFAYMITLSCIN